MFILKHQNKQFVLLGLSKTVCAIGWIIKRLINTFRTKIANNLKTANQSSAKQAWSRTASFFNAAFPAKELENVLDMPRAKL